MFQRPKIPPAPLFSETEPKKTKDIDIDEQPDIVQQYLQPTTSGLSGLFPIYKIYLISCTY